MIIPETPVEAQIVSDAFFQDAILIGKKRGGHPEGCLGTHIEHILAAVDLFPNENREYLRLGALLHDLGKFAEYGKPHLIPENATGNLHEHLLASSKRFKEYYPCLAEHKDRYVPTHAVHSWQYAQKFTENPVVLDLVRYHDTPWRIFNKQADDSLLMNYVGKTPSLFVAFAYIDSIDRQKDVALRLENALVGMGLMKPLLPK